MDDVDRASRESFPASDPPNWSGLRIGPPIHSDRANVATTMKRHASNDAVLGERESAAESQGGR